MELSQPERQILDALLAGTHPPLAILREQLAVGSVERRDLTGVGFFTHFAVPSDAPRLPVRHWVVDDVQIAHPALPYGGGALLFVKNGSLAVLEAFGYGLEVWPDRADGFEVGYLKRGPELGVGAHQLESADARDEAWLEAGYANAVRRGSAGQ